MSGFLRIVGTLPEARAVVSSSSSVVVQLAVEAWAAVESQLPPRVQSDQCAQWRCHRALQYGQERVAARARHAERAAPRPRQWPPPVPIPPNQSQTATASAPQRLDWSVLRLFLQLGEKLLSPFFTGVLCQKKHAQKSVFRHNGRTMSESPTDMETRDAILCRLCVLVASGRVASVDATTDGFQPKSLATAKCFSKRLPQRNKPITMAFFFTHK